MSVDLLDAFTHMEEAHWEYLDADYRHVSFHFSGAPGAPGAQQRSQYNENIFPEIFAVGICRSLIALPYIVLCKGHRPCR